MKNDPIVAQVRKARGEIVHECGNDLARLFDRLRQKDGVKRTRSTHTQKRKTRSAAR